MPKVIAFAITKLHHRYFPRNRYFERLFSMAASKVIAKDENMFNVVIKVTNIGSTDVILMFVI